MDYNLLINLETCFTDLQSYLTLINYTHIPPAVVTLLFGLFVFFQRRDLTGNLLAAVAITFSLYVSLDLVLWWFLDRNSLIIFSWSILGLLSGLLFFFVHWFVHSFISGSKLPIWMITVWTLLLVPLIVFTPTAFNLLGFDAVSCGGVENSLFSNYYYSIGAVAMVLVAISGVHGLLSKSAMSTESRNGKLLVIFGSELFLLAFLVTGVIATYLVDAGLLANFGLEQYGIASMAVFIGMLVYATVRYHAFNIKLIAAQALVVALVILVSSEYLFVTTMTSKILVTLTLGLAVVFGYALIRSVMSEIRQREHIQMLADNLKEINTSQEALMHFISHEVKGSLTKAMGAFDAIAGGSFGEPLLNIKQYSLRAEDEMRKGVTLVSNILEAANLKEGKLEIVKAQFDLVTAVNEVTTELRPLAEAKHLALSVSVPQRHVTIFGDKEKLVRHTLRNLIENAINYSPSGSIVVLLKLDDTGTRAIFTVADTGVGITHEDMQKLFKPGGRGKDSLKVNQHSTGFGLSIAKGIVEAHGGTITAASEGAGMGSTFTVTLPLA